MFNKVSHEKDYKEVKKVKANLSSYFFITPHKSSVFEKLATWSKPDCYILDLQDGCPQDLKHQARINISNHSELPTAIDAQILIRINNFKQSGRILKRFETS